MSQDKNQIKKQVFSFLKSHGVMTLATTEDHQPWVCTVYYGIDNKMNLYIVTDPNSRHGKHLAKNSRVAFNIFDSKQKITKPKKGIQGIGTINMVKGITSVLKALILWHKANPGIERKITIKDIYKKITDTKVYSIKPTYLKYFNQELYHPDEYRILEF